MEWETVIGLEIHAQLSTKSKLFSGSSTEYGQEPNTQANVVDLAMPGVLPVLNTEAVRMAAMFGLAIGAPIGKGNVFARKNYFYPDLPQGYQISQFDKPIVELGHMDITLENGDGNITTKRVGITRAHLEQDAGKSLHEDYAGMTGIDLNRSGTPLLEIVSEPDMSSAKEAVAYMKKIHELVQYLEINDGNLAEGSFRCDANVSVRPKGQKELGTRAELKNINSFRFVERAINIEVERQIDIIEEGGEVAQETRLYDPDKNETRSMRSKEEANDYRYFPCPDLLPIEITDAFLEEVRKTLPELPHTKFERFMKEYELSEYDAGILTATRATADYFEAVAKACNEPKLAANWVVGELSSHLNNNDLIITESPVNSAMLTGLIKRIADKTISGKIAKEVFQELWKGESGDDESATDAVIESKGLKQITDSGAIESLVDEIIANNPAQVEQYRSGKDKVFGFFVGQVMKASQGKANPDKVNEILKAKLS